MLKFFLVAFFTILSSALASTSIDIKPHPAEWKYQAEKTDNGAKLTANSCNTGQAILSVENGNPAMHYFIKRGMLLIRYDQNRVQLLSPDKHKVEGFGRLEMTKGMRVYLILAHTLDAQPTELRPLLEKYLVTNISELQKNGFNIAEIIVSDSTLVDKAKVDNKNSSTYATKMWAEFLPEFIRPILDPEPLEAKFDLQLPRLIFGATYTLGSKIFEASLDELEARRASVSLNGRVINMIFESGASVLLIRKGILINTYHTSANFEGVSAEEAVVYDDDIVVVLLPKCGCYQTVNMTKVVEYFTTQLRIIQLPVVIDKAFDGLLRNYIGTALRIKLEQPQQKKTEQE